MSLVPALFLIAAVAAGLAPSDLRTTTSVRYHLSAKLDNTVDLTAFGAPAQQTSLALDAWVVMTLTDSAGGKAVHVVVDSVREETNMPTITADARATAKGATIHGFLDGTGRMKNLKSSLPSNLLVTSVQGAISGMFPKVRAGAKAGDSWVDTTEINNAGEGNNTTAKVVTTYKAAAAETVGGVAGVRVDAASASTIGGTIENPQSGPMDVEGTGAGKGTFVVAPDGRFLGGSVTSSQDLKLKTPMAPTPIPVKVNQTLTVTLLP